MRVFIIVLSTVLLLLLTFFGIGPVIFADGSMEERIITGVIVLALMLGVLLLARLGMKKYPKTK